jgi:polyribonucleotide nucleotidyltransferase
MSVQTVKTQFGGRELSIETGKLAKQASGSVVVRYGDSVVLVTVTGTQSPREGIDFFPLSVDYIEKTFAAGKIPGGFFKREGRPTESAILTSRFIDRPIRPLFPEGYRNEVQVIATVLSSDADNATDVLAMVGASAALHLSAIPFNGPIAGVCVGRVDGQLVCNPTTEQMQNSDIDLIVSASRDAVVMVEGGSQEVSEAEIIAAIEFAHKSIQPILDMQEELRKLAGQTKWEVKPIEIDTALRAKVTEMAKGKLSDAVRIKEKQTRYGTIDQIKKDLIAALVPADDTTGLKKKVTAEYEELKRVIVRGMILKDKVRIDGRDYKTVRPIWIEAGMLPRAHGSAVFTRGETQALATVTLGTADDQQMIDAISGTYYKRFMLHYNFPPFSVGEVKMLRSPGRREIGHGALAERGLFQVLPDEETFPYTIRIVSEILESNGSSSMATVCGGTIALMDAGVPIKAPVAGIAMGLIQEGKDTAVLSDILGDEDHLGDMDFKVVGTAKGITSLQMDIKIEGLSAALFSQALEQAREGRLHILGEMAKALNAPRAEISPYAPKIITLNIPKDMIGALIGPGGKNIRGITEATGVKIDIDDDGTVHVAAVDGEAATRAIKMIKATVAVPEVGKYYKGAVQKIMEFGAFVEVLPGTDGLVHISQLSEKRVAKVDDVVKEGEEVVVKVLEIDSKGKIRLSMKEAVGHENEVEM